jgi:hypoxia up-regulated 1
MGLLRRSAALAALVVLLAACSGPAPAHASLMAIDLGSEYLRAVLIKPTARGSPIQVVTNEMSRRKSPALVGVAGDDRLLGEEAFSFGIRYPTTVFSRTRDMLGRSASHPFVQNLLSSSQLPYELVDHPERKTAMAKVNETAAYLAEELVVSAGSAGRAASLRAALCRCCRCAAAAGDRVSPPPAQRPAAAADAH